MSIRNKQFSFELADRRDDPEILEVLESGAYEGRISLQFTRRPSPVDSLKKEGDRVKTVVCRDNGNNKIVGLGSVASRRLYVNGEPENVGYLFGLRSRKEYLKRFSMLRFAYEYMGEICRDLDISFFITTILDENDYAKKLLEKKRSFMPEYCPFGDYEVYFLRPKVSRRSDSSFYLRKVSASDVSRLIDFLNESSSRSQFFPMLTEEDLRNNKYAGLKAEDFYILYGKNDGILAAGALWDQREYKQYIVKGYKGILSVLHPVFGMFPCFGWPRLPKIGAPLDFKTLSFWSVRDDDPQIFSRFLDMILSKARSCPFVLVGIDKRSSHRPILMKRPHIIYKSKIYLVDWMKNNQKRPLDQHLIPYLECGML